MIIEAFVKGTNFKKHYDTFHCIKRIERDGAYFILVREYGEGPNHLLQTDLYELRVTY